MTHSRRSVVGTLTGAATVSQEIAAIPSTSKAVLIYGTPKQSFIFPEPEDDGNDGDNVIQEDAQVVG